MSTPLIPQGPRPRRRVLVVSGGLAALVATGAILAVTHAAGHDADPVRPVATGGAAHSTAVDLSGLRWADFHGIRLPSSPLNGPRDRRRGRARGFAHTPGGALFAAVHIAVRANAQWGPKVFEPTIAHQVDGPDTAALLAATRTYYRRLSAKAHVVPGEPIGRAYAAQEAFRMQDYTPRAATFDLVTAGPGADGTTVRAATRVQVVWRHGDWRVLAPPGGDWGNTARTVTSLHGYTRFPERR